MVRGWVGCRYTLPQGIQVLKMAVEAAMTDAASARKGDSGLLLSAMRGLIAEWTDALGTRVDVICGCSSHVRLTSRFH